MSSLSHLFNFLASLKKVPRDEHLGAYLNSWICGLGYGSFIIPHKSIVFWALVVINIRGRPTTISGLVTHIQLNLEDKILTIMFSEHKDLEIPFDDLISMREINEDKIPIQRLLLEEPEHTAITLTKGRSGCNLPTAIRPGLNRPQA